MLTFGSHDRYRFLASRKCANALPRHRRTSVDTCENLTASNEHHRHDTGGTGRRTALQNLPAAQRTIRCMYLYVCTAVLALAGPESGPVQLQGPGFDAVHTYREL